MATSWVKSWVDLALSLLTKSKSIVGGLLEKIKTKSSKVGDMLVEIDYGPKGSDWYGTIKLGNLDGPPLAREPNEPTKLG